MSYATHESWAMPKIQRMMTTSSECSKHFRNYLRLGQVPVQLFDNISTSNRHQHTSQTIFFFLTNSGRKQSSSYSSIIMAFKGMNMNLSFNFFDIKIIQNQFFYKNKSFVPKQKCNLRRKLVRHSPVNGFGSFGRLDFLNKIQKPQ